MPKEPEVIPPSISRDHEYDRQDITSKEFLLAVMRASYLPLAVRLDAAAKVSAYEHPRLAQVAQDVTGGLTIRIQGGLPALPGTNVIMPKLDGVEQPVKGNGKDPSS